MADDNAGTNAIWTPDGMRILEGPQPERVELRPGVMEWIRQFSDVAAVLKLGIHCSLCGKDVIGKNSDAAKVFSVTCGCRELVGQNREWRGHATPLPM